MLRKQLYQQSSQLQFNICLVPNGGIRISDKYHYALILQGLSLLKAFTLFFVLFFDIIFFSMQSYFFSIMPLNSEN